MPLIIDGLSRAVDVALNSVDRISRKVCVSHQGAFSIEQLHTLELFCREICRLRVILVCVVLSLPPFLVSIAFECIPLQNDGWRVNSGAWIRYYFIVFFVTYGVFLQSKVLVPEFRVSYCTIFGTAVANASVMTVMAICVASQWVFPIPFMFALSSGPFTLIVSILFVLLSVQED